jgi:hypothetical protein
LQLYAIHELFLICPGIIGNILAYFPWPIKQLDYGSESFGHTLVLLLGLILFDSMEEKGENYTNNKMKKVDIKNKWISLLIYMHIFN